MIPNLTRSDKLYALVENVVTHADYRGFGFGRTVLGAAVERALAAGCYEVVLMIDSKDPSTLSFYAATGFEQSKTGVQVRRAAVRPE